MRAIKLGVGLVAALLLIGVVSTGSALASEFLASESSKLLAQKVKPQKFVTNAGTIECTGLDILKGTSTAGKSTSQQAEIEYLGCKAFGFLLTVSLAKYLYLANKTVDLENEVIITFGGCVIKVPKQGPLSTVEYRNVGKNIELVPRVTKIKYTDGSGCVSPGTFENGTYEGTSEAMLEGGGTISWDA